MMTDTSYKELLPTIIDSQGQQHTNREENKETPTKKTKLDENLLKMRTDPAKAPEKMVLLS